jgi:ribosomal protein S18 acetylase RimI-like enzyme
VTVPDIVARRATVADEAAASAILDEYFRTLAIEVPDDRMTIRGYLAGPGTLWLAESGDEVVGCVALRPLPSVAPRACEVKRLFVRSAYRGHGVAGILMDALESHARQSRYDAIYLDTKDVMQAAIRFYVRRGYEPIARYNDNPEATIFMRRPLSESTRGS